MTEASTTNEQTKLASILKDSNYSLDLFELSEIHDLESKIFLKNSKPHINCLVRNKIFNSSPKKPSDNFMPQSSFKNMGIQKKD
ncbi:hypothetical protein EBZ35_05180 [bacterium]|nr:hypothetical protein [bacterium]